MTAPVEALLAEARAAAARGDGPARDALYRRIVDQAPDDPRLLNTLGNEALRLSAVAGARGLFGRAVAIDPAAAPLWMNLALAERQAGDPAAELAALDAALGADPYFLVALIEKARWHERHGPREACVRTYRAIVDATGDGEGAAPALREVLEHGRALVRAEDEAMRQAIVDAVGDAAPLPHRFARALDVVAGRAKIHHPKPAGLHYPFLPAQEFFDRALFPWFDRLEAATATIRDELAAALAAGFANVPYVRIAPGQPVNQWLKLNDSLDWGALFLWKNGEPNAPLLAACPGTAALIDELPLMKVPGRSPTVMWSTLKPRAHIPPHHGVTNIRAVVHLPLIVPDDCTFRVGGETRSWVEGRAWAFDDTIEHEATNGSDATRVILIADAWNPFLTEEERRLLGIADRVLGDFGRGEG